MKFQVISSSEILQTLRFGGRQRFSDPLPANSREVAPTESRKPKSELPLVKCVSRQPRDFSVFRDRTCVCFFLWKLAGAVGDVGLNPGIPLKETTSWTVYIRAVGNDHFCDTTERAPQDYVFHI